MNSGTPWWGTILVAAITALAALGGTAMSTWRQNRRAGREEWFRRVQWAEELAATGDDVRAAAGYRVLSALSDSPLATADDKKLLLRMIDGGTLDLTRTNAALLDEIEFTVDTDNETSEEGA